MDTNTNGYPTVASGAIGDGECDDLFTALLQNAPTIQAVEVANEAAASVTPPLPMRIGITLTALTTAPWYGEWCNPSLPTLVYDSSAGTITRSN